MQLPTVDWVFPQQWLIQTIPHRTAHVPVRSGLLSLRLPFQATPDSSVKMKLGLRACVTWEGFNQDPEESSRGDAYCSTTGKLSSFAWISLRVLKKRKKKKKLTFTRHNRITCPETMHSAAKNLHIDKLKNSSRLAPNVCVGGKWGSTGWNRTEVLVEISLQFSLRGRRKRIALIIQTQKTQYPHTKNLIQSFQGSCTQHCYWTT